jgi:uncharacterized protein
MVEPITINVRHLSQDVHLPQEQVQAAIDLLDAGFPIPFIAKYRKEATKNLDEESLRQIAEELYTARMRCERKQAILKTIEAAGKLTPDLDKSIRDAKSVKRLEDIYLPFKPKQQSLATMARDSGLEPFALELLAGTLPPEKVDERAAEFINEDKKVKSIADVLLGAGHIIADVFGCKAELMHKVREALYQHGTLTTTKIGGVPVSKKEEKGKTPRTSQNTGDSTQEIGEAAPSDTSLPTPDSFSEETHLADASEQPTDTTEDADKAENVEQTIELHDAGVPSDRGAATTVDQEDKEIGEEITADITEYVADESPEAAEAVESEMEASENETTDDTDASEAETESSIETPQDDTQEVTELFQQLQEAQAEKGLPVVKSQNALKKKKKADKKKKLDDIKQRQREHFERQFAEYFDFSVKLRGIPAHRILSFNRGERHKIIQVAITINEAKVLESVKEICVPADHVHADFLTGCLQDALHKGILPMLIREVRNEMTEYAEKSAVKIFGHNLRNLLLQRPLPHKRVLVLDPGGQNGCKVVALDEFGNLIGHETIFLTGNAERREQTGTMLAGMIQQFGISVIAIGIGGGSRVAEEMVARMIETHFHNSHSQDSHSANSHSNDSHNADSDLAYVMVNKLGSIAYSTSQVAKEELPHEDPFVRAAVSIGRRLQNPINELVKIDPTHLGVGISQNDMKSKYLKQILAEIVESCVNIVGIDLNSATPSLLACVAGLNPMTARRIYEYRREHGAFRTREDLKKVPGISGTAYTHAAGFLRITGGDNLLDATNIHPENYELTTKIIETLGFSVSDLRNSETAQAVADKIVSENIDELTIKLSSELNANLDTVKDILENLSKPGWDVRELQPPLMFRRTTLKIENLTPGIELTGTILNVTDFGAFVDIGLHESGFIHISQMSTGYTQSAHEKVSSGNIVHLWVVEADAAKKRVSLTLLHPDTEKQSPRSGDKRGERPPRTPSSRPPRPDRERRELSDKPREGTPRGEKPPRDSREGKRFGRQHSGGQHSGRGFDRAPKTFVSAPVKKEMKPITDKMKQGKEPMRSFSDLAQLFGRVQTSEEEGKREK